MSQPEGGKGLRGPVEVQPIMVEALWGQKMDFQSPGRQDTGQKAQGAELQERKCTEPCPNEASALGKGLGGETQGLNK
jgi:hypothetical protein